MTDLEKIIVLRKAVRAIRDKLARKRSITAYETSRVAEEVYQLACHAEVATASTKDSA